MKNTNKKLLLPTITILTLLAVTGCDNNSSVTIPEPPPPPPPPVMNDYSFEVVVTNLTHGQPLSPAVVVSHEDITLWSVGSSASPELETLAESGDNSQIMALGQIIDAVSGAGIIMPGMNATLMLDTTNETIPMLSIATMLVNSNDAFSGMTGIDVSSMAIGDIVNYSSVAYDAGTEGNTEAAGSIPGPADGGEGYNSARDDVDFVSLHNGFVTMDDGLATSVLTEAQKIDNPVMKITITRLQ